MIRVHIKYKSFALYTVILSPIPVYWNREVEFTYKGRTSVACSMIYHHKKKSLLGRIASPKNHTESPLSAINV